MKGTLSSQQILLALAIVAAAGCSHAPVVTMTPATAAEAPPVSDLPSSAAAIPAVKEDDAEPLATQTAAVRTRLHEKPALVNVRPEPGTARAPIAVLKGGKVVEVLEEQGGMAQNPLAAENRPGGRMGLAEVRERVRLT